MKIQKLAIAAVLLAATAAPAVAAAGPGFAPPTPSAPVAYRCAPDVGRATAEAVLVRGNGHRYQLVEGRKFFRLLTAEQQRRAVWCDAVAAPARVQR